MNALSKGRGQWTKKYLPEIGLPVACIDKYAGKVCGQERLCSDWQRQKFVEQFLKLSLLFDTKCNGHLLHLGPKDLHYVM